MGMGDYLKECLVISFVLLLLCLCVDVLLPQEEEERLSRLSREITESLRASKALQIRLMEQLDEAMSDSETSKRLVAELEAKSTALSVSLTNTHVLLMTYEERTLDLEAELKHYGAMLWKAGMVLALLVFLKLVRIILGLVRPEVNKVIPQWVDIII